MTPLDAIRRLGELGITLHLHDLPSVERLHITMEGVSPQFATLVTGMQPKTVTLPGAQMTTDDLPVLLNFPQLTAICAHQLPFASSLFATGLPFPQLSSIAMSNTPLNDKDIGTLKNKSCLLYTSDAADE